MLDVTKERPEVTISYIDFTDFAHGSVRARVGDNLATLDDIFAMATFLRKALSPFVDSVELSLREPTVDFCIDFAASTNPDDDPYHVPERIKPLLEVVRPAYNYRVSGMATVVRENGKHVQTEVRLTPLSNSDARTALELRRDVSGPSPTFVDRTIPGVGRVLFYPATGETVFAMSEPAVSNNDGRITNLAATVAEYDEALLVGPVELVDDSPNAALYPENDWRPSTDKE